MYKAIVVRLSDVQPHPNSDRGLQTAQVSGYTVVVGPEQKEGDLGIFFPCDGQLHEDFAKANDLMERLDPVTGKKVGGGMFKANLRVTAQSIRGIKSYGFWIPIASLGYIQGLNFGVFVEGFEFDSVKVLSGEEFPICRKYITKATQEAAMQKGVGGARETLWFKMHQDTEQWRHNGGDVEDLSLLTITEKVHGTSHRFGLVWQEIKGRRSLLDWIFRRKPKRRTVPAYVSGTRRVVLGWTDFPEDYEFPGEKYRDIAVKRFMGKLHQGETVYFEIVGYAGGGALIMDAQDTNKVAEFRGKYPALMQYTYGCQPGEFRVLVYRMGIMNQEGYWVEYPWALVKERCRQMNVAYVPELVNTFAFGAGDLDFVDSELHGLASGPSTIDKTHIKEGVVVRVDAPNGRTYWLKHKSWEFLFLEGVLKERPEYVDAEEAA
jgi:hypothetical protein